MDRACTLGDRRPKRKALSYLHHLPPALILHRESDRKPESLREAGSLLVKPIEGNRLQSAFKGKAIGDDYISWSPPWGILCSFQGRHNLNLAFGPVFDQACEDSSKECICSLRDRMLHARFPKIGKKPFLIFLIFTIVGVVPPLIGFRTEALVAIDSQPLFTDKLTEGLIDERGDGTIRSKRNMRFPNGMHVITGKGNPLFLIPLLSHFGGFFGTYHSTVLLRQGGIKESHRLFKIGSLLSVGRFEEGIGPRLSLLGFPWEYVLILLFCKFFDITVLFGDGIG